MGVSKYAAIAVFALCGSASAAGPEDVHWCLTGDADSRIDQQPMRDYCPWVLAGSAAGVWYAPEYASYIFGRDQRGWSNEAAKLSCSNDPAAMAAAVGLIAACQCHNAGAADWVVDNGAAVIKILRQHAGC